MSVLVATQHKQGSGVEIQQLVHGIDALHETTVLLDDRAQGGQLVPPLAVGGRLQQRIIPTLGERWQANDRHSGCDARLVGCSIKRAERAHGDPRHTAALDVHTLIRLEMVKQCAQVAIGFNDDLVHQHVAVEAGFDRIGALLRIVKRFEGAISPLAVVRRIECDREDAMACQAIGQLQPVFLATTEAMQNENHRRTLRAVRIHCQQRNVGDGRGITDQFHGVAPVKAGK